MQFTTWIAEHWLTLDTPARHPIRLRLLCPARLLRCMSESLQLYRKLLRAVNGIPVRPIQRKLSYNIRQLFDLYRLPQPGTELTQLHLDAEAAVQVLKWFRNLPQVWCDWSFCTVLVVHTDPTPHCVTRQQHMTCFESTHQLYQPIATMHHSAVCLHFLLSRCACRQTSSNCSPCT